MPITRGYETILKEIDDRLETLNDQWERVHFGRVFTTTIVSLNIPEFALFTDFVKRLKNDRCFHELN